MSETVAAIDCGSHSTRLLIERDRQPLVREIELTKLGQGLSPGGTLTQAALGRMRATLGRYREILDAHQVDRIRVGATAAARRATNQADFVTQASAIVGVPVQILSADEEARLTFAGATAGLTGDGGPFLVVDIGGASTELAIGTTDCEGSISLDIGSVAVTEQYLMSDPPGADELSAAITITGAWLDDVDRELPNARQANTVIGVAGTVATAVAVELGLPGYDRERIHHFALTRDAAEDVFRTLATESRDDRAHNPGLPPGRVDTIVGGMAILVKIMRHFDLDQLIASESDILDSLARSLYR